MPDDVNHPSHYNQGNIECIDAIEAAVSDFPSYCQGNAIKYLYRHAYKGNPVQDLEKAIWYINKLKEHHETKRLPKQASPQQPRSESTRVNEQNSSAFPWNRELPETD